eukprot:1141157-Pelagomonas_calceolata.AAC.9
MFFDGIGQPSAFAFLRLVSLNAASAPIGLHRNFVSFGVSGGIGAAFRVITPLAVMRCSMDAASIRATHTLRHVKAFGCSIISASACTLVVKGVKLVKSVSNSHSEAAQGLVALLHLQARVQLNEKSNSGGNL